MVYHVYILLCEDGYFYTGYTKDLERRVKEHMKGQGSRYVKAHRMKRLVYNEEVETKREAIIRERKIKNLNHEAKRSLTL